MLLKVNVIKYYDQSEYKQMVKLREINIYHLIQELQGLTVMLSFMCSQLNSPCLHLELNLGSLD